jgi:hypothetical protein
VSNETNWPPAGPSRRASKGLVREPLRSNRPRARGPRPEKFRFIAPGLAPAARLVMRRATTRRAATGLVSPINATGFRSRPGDRRRCLREPGGGASGNLSREAAPCHGPAGFAGSGINSYPPACRSSSSREHNRITPWCGRDEHKDGRSGSAKCVTPAAAGVFACADDGKRGPYGPGFEKPENPFPCPPSGTLGPIFSPDGGIPPQHSGPPVCMMLTGPSEGPVPARKPSAGDLRNLRLRESHA